MADATGVNFAAIAQAIGRGDGYESLSRQEDAEIRRVRGELKAAVQRVASEADNNVFGSVDDRWVSLAQSFLAQQGEQYGAQRIESAHGGYEARFDNLDPGWLRFLVIWVQRHRKHAFAPLPDVEEIAADARLALLADWGTGLYGAPVCARSIASARPAPHAVIHLGDIYYAGDEDEIRKRFLAFWPEVPGARNLALNGNHEMYTGGNAYFDALLGDPRFAQSSSCFALRNNDWLLVGLDTAFDEHDLHSDQAAWLEQIAEEHPDHRLMLFSHHQPFSAFEGQGPKLVLKLASLLGTGRIAAWYWGHEHSCVRYDLHPGWRMYGRCVGHSGFPYFRFLANGRPNHVAWEHFESKSAYMPGGVVLDGPNTHIPGVESLYGPNGYVIVELRGRAAHETYHAADGAVLAEFDIQPPT